MADETKLPATITERGVVPAEQSGSLVTRGLEAIKNRQRTLVSVSVEADPEKSFREGVEADKRGDFAEAVKWYRKAADQGHASAQFNLAINYEKGQGVPQDDAAAMSWYRKAAELGNARAQSNLGAMYAKGQGIPQDCVAAVSWYRQAADQGYPSAEFNLGGMYLFGRGLPQDYAEAIKWLHRAAERGLATAEFALGDMYANGKGVPQDYVQAHMWLDRATRSASDTEVRDLAVEYKDAIAARMTPVQIAEAQRLVRKRTESHASRRKRTSPPGSRTSRTQGARQCGRVRIGDNQNGDGAISITLLPSCGAAIYTVG
jgi:tetratricopeptide (TPR) repeat protein